MRYHHLTITDRIKIEAYLDLVFSPSPELSNSLTS